MDSEGNYRRSCSYCEGDGFKNVTTGPDPNERGTPERVAIYAARYRAGEPLWHPQDFRHSIE